ncbi:MAG: hypothetical protein ACJ8AT_39940 [Hyalangium sp.]|uniref:hypothetical protein n=1 Tax=Hyalangium sp. TaxID=2028555 RepID=UPI00389AC066
MVHSTQQLPESQARTQPLMGGAAVPLPFFPEGDDEATDPRAEGACLFDMSPAEWRFVRNAPLVGFLLVASADGAVVPRKCRALVSALEEGKRSSCGLFRAVCRELYRQRDNLLELFVTDTFERDQLAEAYGLVHEKLGPKEAEHFRACLLKVGRQVAKASGGWRASWGLLRGVERRALAELDRTFGHRS